VAAIAASIKEWGWTTPALVGEDGGLIAGHARVLAARQLGIAKIPGRLFLGKLRAVHKAGRPAFFGDHAALAEPRAFAAFLAPLLARPSG
jgi:hypothetical protein